MPSPRVLLRFGPLLLGAALAVWFGLAHRAEQRTTREQVDQTVSREAADAARQLAERVQPFKTAAESLAADIGAGRVAFADLEAELDHRVRDLEGTVSAMGVALEPGLHPDADANGDWSVYVYRDGDGVVSKRRDYRYRDPREDKGLWYRETMAAGTPRWLDPKFSSTSKRFIASYCVPIPNAKGGRALGLVSVNYFLDDLRGALRNHSHRAMGFAMVVNDNDRLVFHPNEAIAKAMAVDVEGGRSCQELLARRLTSVRDATPRRFVHPDPEDDPEHVCTGRIVVWGSAAPIRDTSWRLVVAISEDEIGAVRTTATVPLILSTWLAVFGAICVFVARPGMTLRSWWIVSSAAGACMVGAVAMLWSVAAYDSTHASESGATRLAAETEVRNEVDKYCANCEHLYTEPPLFVPTGALIRSIVFTGANEVSVTGYVWQRYPAVATPSHGHQIIVPGNHERLAAALSRAEQPISRGVVFPEAVDGNVHLRLEDAEYRDTTDGVETIGWHFQVRLRQPFDYRRFPFDAQNVWVRLQHADFDENVILVPDLHAYPSTYPSARAGLDLAGMVLPGWDVVRTYFSFRDQAYETDFGIVDFGGRNRFPELYYNVILQRRFLDPFISFLAPIVMIFMILFIVLLISRRGDGEGTKFGFTTFAVLGTVTGLLFSVTFWHVGMRTHLEGTDASFFESFYFVSYAMFAYVAIVGYGLARVRSPRWLLTGEHAVQKMVFWPIVGLAVLGATLVMLF